jgi:hypothetical protein
MGPELKVFFFVSAVMVFAYTALAPLLGVRTLRRMMQIDVVASAGILLAVGTVYFGSGIGFSLFFFDVPWWVFALLSAAVAEAPLLVWFCRKWGIDLMAPPD